MFRITTWNVNGLRAALKNNADQWWEEYDPDLLCLQEVRARPDQLTAAQREALEKRNPVWNPGERVEGAHFSALFFSSASTFFR